MTDPLLRRIRLAELCSLYGKLLTQRQRRMLRLYHDHDMSLGEIAQEVGVSRQAVHDTLSRAAASLENYERLVGLWALRCRLRRYVDELETELGTTGSDRARSLVRRLAEELDFIGSDDVV